jgi:hypothetical protein
MPNHEHAGTVEAHGTNGRAIVPAAAAVGAGVVLGVAVVVGVLRKTSTRADDGRSTALATYLRDHLSGSDAAIRVVERLRRTHGGTAEGRLFAALFEEFQREREVVRALLAEIGSTTLSAKRLVTGASGLVTGPVAGGDRGEFGLFRTLEALAIGVQGKRLLWRTMLDVEPTFTTASRNRLGELESLATRQWEAIDQRRRALARVTFAGTPVTR